VLQPAGGHTYPKRVGINSGPFPSSRQQPTQPHRHQGLQLAGHQRTHPHNPYFLTCSRPMSDSAIPYSNSVASQPASTEHRLSSLQYPRLGHHGTHHFCPIDFRPPLKHGISIASTLILVCPSFHRSSPPTFLARSNVKPANTWSTQWCWCIFREACSLQPSTFEINSFEASAPTKFLKACNISFPLANPPIKWASACSAPDIVSFALGSLP